MATKKHHWSNFYRDRFLQPIAERWAPSRKLKTKLFIRRDIKRKHSNQMFSMANQNQNLRLSGQQHRKG